MNLKIELRCIPFPLIILEMFLQLNWSPPVVNSVDWTYFGKAHTCPYKLPQLTVHVRAQTKHEVKGIVCRPPRQDCLEEQIWGRVQKKCCCFERPNENSGLHHPKMEEVRNHLNPIEHLWRDLKMAVPHFPSNLMELERCCKEE